MEPPGETLETFVRTKTGETRKIAWRNAALRDAEGTITAVLRSGEDVTAQREAGTQVTFLAYHDRLTGLANRSLLEEHLTRPSRARRSARPSPCSTSTSTTSSSSTTRSATRPATSYCARSPAGSNSASEAAVHLCLARHGGDEFMLLLERPF